MAQPLDENPNPIQLKHPKGLYLLFFTEMWERFSYYGMRALLSLYLVTKVTEGGLGWGEKETGHLYGIYTGLVYVLPLLGGWLADRYLGFRTAVIIGGAIMALGHGSLAIEGMTFFYLGLGLLILGNGFFKPNISSMVGQLYPEGSPLKDSAYTIFYMGINVGAFAGTLICGYLGEKVSWHAGFGAAGIGMLAGLIIFVSLKNLLGKIGITAPAKEKVGNEEAEDLPLTKSEVQRLWVIVVLSLFTIVFWTGFEQAGSSMNIFALKHVDRTIGSFEIPASWFQSVNAFFIFTLAPLFSGLWIWLEKKKKDPSGPVKFSFGLFFLGTGFLFLVFGTLGGTKAQMEISMIWLVLAYLFHTLGELCLSPVGLSYVSKLSPLKLVGLIYGVWFLASAVGNYTAGYMSGLMEKYSMSVFFSIFVVISFLAGGLLLLFNPILKKWMHGVK